jgi:glycosyltransferase 2 family protein
MKLSRNAKRLFFFILLSVVSISIILFLTVNEKTFEALGEINPMFLLYCLLLWFACLSIDSLGITFFILGTGEKIRFFNAYKLTVIRVFFNLITPFTFGGQPFIVYVLNKFGVPGGKASAIVMTRLMCILIFTLALGIIALVLFNQVLINNSVISSIFAATVIFATTVFTLLILLLLFPPLSKVIIKLAGYVGKKVSLIKDPEKFNKKAVTEIHNMRNSFINYFKKHFGYFSLGFICAGLYFFIHLVIIYVIINGVGVDLGVKQGLASSSLLYFCISFMPTPGSSGFGDGFFVLIFQGSVPLYLIGIVVVLWRFFFQYLTAIIGALSSARFFSRVVFNGKTVDNEAAKEIAKEKGNPKSDQDE